MLGAMTRTAGLMIGCLWCGAAPADGADRSTPVHKVAEDFEQMAWVADPWSNAKGATALASTPAPDVKTAKCLEVSATYSGKGFEHFTADPVAPALGSRRAPGRDRPLQDQRSSLCAEDGLQRRLGPRPGWRQTT